MNLTSKQDTVKLHAIALLSMMSNVTVTVLHNLLHAGLTRAPQKRISVIDFSAPLWYNIGSFSAFFRTNVQFQDFSGPDFSVSINEEACMKNLCQ